MPVHAGSAAYIDDDEQTFFDKYSDMIYIGAMLLGVLASGITAVLGRLSGARPSPLELDVARLIALMGEARVATSTEELDAVQGEADQLMARALDGSLPRVDDRRLAAFGMVLDQVRAAVRDRRAQIGSAPSLAEVVVMPLAAE